MAQFAAPTADLLTDAEWTATPYWSKVDTDDADVIANGTPETSEIIALALSSLTDPAVSTGHIIRAVFQKVSGPGVLRLSVQLRQGYVNEGTQGTLIAIAEFDEGDIGVFETYALTLPDAVADAITDYADLQYRLWASRNNGGLGRPIEVRFAQFEVPDAAPTGETVAVAAEIGPLALSATIDATSDVSVAGSLPGLTLAASLDSSADASVAATLPALGLSAQIDVAAVTAEVVATLGPLELAASTQSQADVSIGASLPALELSATTTTGGTVEVAASLPALGLSATTTSGADVSVDGGLPALDLAAQITAETVTVSFAAGLGLLELAAALDPSAVASIDAALPSLQLAATTDASGSVAVAGTLPALGLSATLVAGMPADMDIDFGTIQSRWVTGTMAQRWMTGELTHT